MSARRVARGGGSAGGLLGCALMLLVVATALPAAAQSETGNATDLSESVDKEDASQDQRRMLELNEEGFEAFEAGDYVEAARTFEEAHEHVPDPNLRKNEAIAWFHAGRCHEASEAASFFLLADEMTVADRIEARSVLGHCRLDEAEEAIDRGDYQRAERLIDYVGALEADERVEERHAAMVMALEDGRAGKPGLAQADSGTLLVGLGVALVAGNALYHAVSAGQRDQLAQLERDDANPIRREQLADNLETADWLVPSLYAAGGASIGGGLWVGLRADSARTSKPAGDDPLAGRHQPAPVIQLGWTKQF